MSNPQFHILAALVLSGEATKKQLTEFEDMLNTSKEKQIAFEKLKRVWHTDLRDNESFCLKQGEHLWQRYQRERHLQKRKAQQFFIKIAAGLLLLVAAGLSFYLSDLQKANNDRGAQVAVIEIVKETKRGEKLKTRLPDGTLVMLNAKSRLSFPENFTDSTRTVHLIGEAYFDVAEDKNRPFTVKTQNMDVTALGTAFGVNVYPGNSSDHVALVSGKLLIRNANNEIRIDSGQAVTLSKADNRFSKSDIDYLTQVAWKDGVLHFSDDRFREIVDALELNYGIRFSIEDEVLDSIRDTYTGTFKNESLDNILKVLSFSMGFKYDINGKEILITKN